MPEASLKDELIETDDAFRSLYEEHQACEERLEALHQGPAPSMEDELEIKRIKLHKLALKDQMEAMMMARRRQLAPA